MRHALEALVLVGIVFISRLIPHPPNATFTGSVALYARNRFGIQGFFIPIAGLILSDVLLGLYDWRLLVSIYGSFGVYFLLGQLLSRETPLHIIALTSISASTIFFLLTNTAVWALSTWYPPTVMGFFACLTAGLPFYRNMLIADIIGTTYFFKVETLSTRFNTTLSSLGDQKMRCSPL